jgi:hypothetical protein
MHTPAWTGALPLVTLKRKVTLIIGRGSQPAGYVIQSNC